MDMKREHRVTIRLTDIEFSIIENAAEQAEMSISEYMRTQTMEGNVTARYFNQGGIISSEMRNEIRKSLRDIYEMKYKVMKMAGDFRGSN